MVGSCRNVLINIGFDILDICRYGTGDTGNEDNSNFARFLNLTNSMPCSVLPGQAAWQVILISLKSS